MGFSPMFVQPSVFHTFNVHSRYGLPLVAEQKHDGLRAYIRQGRLFNRRGKDITHKFPEFSLQSLQLFDKKFVFDGEIVARSGKFEDVVGRVHLADDFLILLTSKKYPATFMCFDVVEDGVDEDKVALSERRKRLELFQQSHGYLIGWFDVVEQFRVLNGKDFDAVVKKFKHTEGVVVKNVNSSYRCGSRPPFWFKLKNFEDVVATFVRYERNPAGALLFDEAGRSVQCAGVLSKDVCRRIDDSGSVLCEVQILEKTASGSWRSPSFKRLLR